MEKDNSESFAFVDLTGSYGDVGLRGQFHPGNVLKLMLADALPFLLKKVARKVKNQVPRGRRF